MSWNDFRDTHSIGKLPPKVTARMFVIALAILALDVINSVFVADFHVLSGSGKGVDNAYNSFSFSNSANVIHWILTPKFAAGFAQITLSCLYNWREEHSRFTGDRRRLSPGLMIIVKETG